MQIQDASIYVYKPSEMPGRTELTLYHRSGRKQSLDFENSLERTIRQALNESAPHINPNTVLRLKDTVVVIKKYVAHDCFNRDSLGAAVLLGKEKTFSALRGITHICTLPFLENLISTGHIDLKTIQADAIVKFSEDGLSEYINGNKIASLPKVTLLAHLLENEERVAVNFRTEEIEQARDIINASLCMLFSNGADITYEETISDDVGTIILTNPNNQQKKKFLSYITLKKPHVLNLTATVPETDGNFYDCLIAAVRQKIFSDRIFGSLNICHSAASYFGTEQLSEFIKQFKSMRCAPYQNLLLLAKNLFAVDKNKITELYCKLVDNFGEQRITAIIENFSGLRSEFYESIVNAINLSLFSDDASKATLACYKLAANFGENKVVEFIRNHNTIHTRNAKNDLIVAGLEKLLLDGPNGSALREMLAKSLGQGWAQDFLQNYGEIRTRIFDNAKVAARNKLFFDDTRKTILLCHKLAEFFGYEQFDMFINNYNIISSKCYVAAKTVLEHQILSNDHNKSTELFHKFSAALGEDIFANFIINYQQTKSNTYAWLIHAVKHGLLPVANLAAAETYFKLIEFFGNDIYGKNKTMEYIRTRTG